MRDALSKYDIFVEAGSSSYDSEEKRRSDALSRRNLAMQAKQSWLPVNMKKAYESVMQTFEKSNKEDLFEQDIPQPMPLTPPNNIQWPQQVEKLPTQEPLPAL